MKQTSFPWSAMLASVLASLLASVPPASRAALPAVDAAFLTRLSAAANHGDQKALMDATAPGVTADYSWTRTGPSLIGRSLPWEARLLEMPGGTGGGGTVFIAFSKYHPCESIGDHLYRVAAASDGPRLGPEIPETDIEGWRVRDHKLAVRFIVPAKSVQISDRVSIQRLPGALDDALLRINSIYTVDSVRSEGKALTFRQAGGFLAVRPPAGERVTFDLAYHARIERGAEDYILPNQAGLTSYWYPHTGRLPATADVRITVPRGWTAIGEGEATARASTGSSTTFAFHNGLAVCYITVAAGKYTVTTHKIGGVPVSAYLLHHTASRARTAIHAASGALQWFSRNLSAFPYSRYAVVETDVFPAALECYSFTLCGRSTIPAAVPHEVSHTWWGGIVPNTYTRTLWNESFAEYSDGLYGRMTGRGGMHAFNAQMMSAMRPLMSSASLMEAHDAMDMAGSAIGYGKGSLVLETLERMLGTQKMLSCMRRFIADHRRGEDAEWQDFIDAVAAVAGPEWRGFFPSWLATTTLPELKLSDVAAARRGAGYAVSGVVRQSGPAFWMKLPVVVDTEAGQTLASVDVRGPSSAFTIQTTSRPTRVSLDPRRETLRGGASSQSPALLALQTADQPLLVVRASGGPEAERTALLAVTDGLKNAYPFARITVLADVDATPEKLASANVLLLGRPESLKLPAGWPGKLPLAYGDDAITESATGTRHAGAGLWGLSLQPHPSRPGGILAHAAGASPGAIRGFVKQGDLPSMDSVFVVQADGKVVTARALGGDDPTVVQIRM